jgi:hypothetical protein
LYYRQEIDLSAADMDSDDSVCRINVLPVSVEGFTSKQVNRNRITRKRIYDQNVKLLILAPHSFLFQQSPRIAQHHVNMSGRVLNVSEYRMRARR